MFSSGSRSVTCKYCNIHQIQYSLSYNFILVQVRTIIIVFFSHSKLSIGTININIPDHQIWNITEVQVTNAM